jgi:hypothetical protein
MAIVRVESAAGPVWAASVPGPTTSNMAAVIQRNGVIEEALLRGLLTVPVPRNQGHCVRFIQTGQDSR